MGGSEGEREGGKEKAQLTPCIISCRVLGKSTQSDTTKFISFSQSNTTHNR